MMKIVNIDEENLHTFWATWVISIKNSGKVCFIKLKVPKKQGFAASLENTVLEKP